MGEEVPFCQKKRRAGYPPAPLGKSDARLKKSTNEDDRCLGYVRGSQTLATKASKRRDLMLELMKEEEAANVLRLKADTLKRWRLMGRGPAFYRLGGAIRYRLSDIEIFLNNSHKNGERGA